MIEIESKIENGTAEFTMRGHAQADGEGKPNLACASASTLAYTLLGALRNLAEGSILELRIHSGDLYLMAKYNEKTDSIFQTVWVGFLQLAKTYPDQTVIRFDEKFSAIGEKK